MQLQPIQPEMSSLSAVALLKGANTALALFFAIFCLTIVVCYPLESMFSINQLVIGHMTMLFSATFIKIAYVTRCVALKQLNREVA